MLAICRAYRVHVSPELIARAMQWKYAHLLNSQSERRAAEDHVSAELQGVVLLDVRIEHCDKRFRVDDFGQNGSDQAPYGEVFLTEDGSEIASASAGPLGVRVIRRSVWRFISIFWTEKATEYELRSRADTCSRADASPLGEARAIRASHLKIPSQRCGRWSVSHGQIYGGAARDTPLPASTARRSYLLAVRCGLRPRLHVVRADVAHGSTQSVRGLQHGADRFGIFCQALP
jgi:hypothetical protein